MELIAIRTATVLFHVELERINPRRRAVDRDLARRLVERYEFLKYPQTYTDYSDPESGVTFAKGVFDGFDVAELRVFTNGFLISTGDSTDLAEKLFEDMLPVWLAAGVPITPEMVSRKGYISQITVQADVDLLCLNTAIDEVLENWFPRSRTDGWRGPAGIAQIGIFTQGNIEAPSPIRIEHLSGVPIEANQFWAQAPLPTKLHLSFLTKWETVLKGQR